MSAFVFSALFPSLHAQSTSAAIASDPAPDKTNPATMQAFQLPSHGAMLNAIVYIAAGVGPHPVVVLLHGFPGNEKNLDLAQAVRRAGWDVLYFDYRGSWGSPGDFSFTHSIEDAQAAIAYMRDAGNAKRLRADPTYIVLIGHSMGGFLARIVAANDAGIRAIGLISAADMGVDRVETMPAEQRKPGLPSLAAGFAAEGMAPLAGCTPESLAREVIAHADSWNTVNLAAKLAARPVLVITSNDGLAPSNDAFFAALENAGDAQAQETHMETDHVYSDHRIALAQAMLEGLATLKP